MELGGGNSDKEATQWALKQESKDGVNSYSEPRVSQSVVYGPHQYRIEVFGKNADSWAPPD